MGVAADRVVRHQPLEIPSAGLNPSGCRSSVRPQTHSSRRRRARSAVLSFTVRLYCDAKASGNTTRLNVTNYYRYPVFERGFCTVADLVGVVSSCA